VTCALLVGRLSKHICMPKRTIMTRLFDITYSGPAAIAMVGYNALFKAFSKGKFPASQNSPLKSSICNIHTIKPPKPASFNQCT